MPSTSNVGTSIQITWVAPYNGGTTITQYDIKIKAANGSYYGEATYCNGRTDSTVISSKYCVIPTSTLMADPFNLVQGSIVQAIVLASNVIGDSAYSIPNTVGADIRTAPHQPALAPFRGSLTTTSQIEVKIAPLTGSLTGGQQITSYLIEYDGGSSGSQWYEI